MKIARALLSVTDKTGIVDFGKALRRWAWRSCPRAARRRSWPPGREGRRAFRLHGQPEILSGRVKTLHPRCTAASSRAGTNASTGSSWRRRIRDDRSRVREPLPVPGDGGEAGGDAGGRDREHRHRRSGDDPVGGEELGARGRRDAPAQYGGGRDAEERRGARERRSRWRGGVLV